MLEGKFVIFKDFGLGKNIFNKFNSLKNFFRIRKLSFNYNFVNRAGVFNVFRAPWKIVGVYGKRKFCIFFNFYDIFKINFFGYDYFINFVEAVYKINSGEVVNIKIRVHNDFKGQFKDFYGLQYRKTVYKNSVYAGGF